MKTAKVIIAISVSIITCLCAISAFSTTTLNMISYTTFCFDQETLRYIFADEVPSAESFCKTKGANTALYGRYKYAKANDDGTLTVAVDHETLRLWKSSNWTLQVLESLLEEKGRTIGVDIDWSTDELNTIRAVKKCGLDISEDYSLVTQGPGDDASFYVFLVPACIYTQIFQGKQIDEVKVTYIEVDEQGNIIDEIIWEHPSNNKS